jgi:hypothetical protein
MNIVLLKMSETACAVLRKVIRKQMNLLDNGLSAFARTGVNEGSHYLYDSYLASRILYHSDNMEFILGTASERWGSCQMGGHLALLVYNG